MALNDMSMRAQGTDVYPGVANPTQSSSISDPMATNFVDDPTKDELGAGAPANFRGHREAKHAMRGEAGVVEARPGILDDTNIDPLNENSNKDDGWANATKVPGSGSVAQQATEKASETVTSAQKAAASNRTDASTGATGAINSAMGVATGAAKMAYGTVTGNKQYFEQGKEGVFGEGS
ncbi:hypothetical protein M422DRAFT_47305 [Sphaerobolus stellatus SS14]|uniref:Uncharacterized protein n=1 Tax=Sphaerobolus stellatus (strain SS14) TaxID=990650 RepID=A0A0C9VZZ8_SPHS4|nr:hypothetical protein M422DRAFT_47305 [Sphaerobolus stellatus SS14]